MKLTPISSYTVVPCVAVTLARPLHAICGQHYGLIPNFSEKA